MIQLIRSKKNSLIIFMSFIFVFSFFNFKPSVNAEEVEEINLKKAFSTK